MAVKHIKETRHISLKKRVRRLKRTRNTFPTGEEIKSWRYQPVYVEYDRKTRELLGNEYSMCEVYLDKDEKLVMWSVSHHIGPFGYGLDGLIDSLQKMMDEVRHWKAVPFKSLKPGMVFERIK